MCAVQPSLLSFQVYEVTEQPSAGLSLWATIKPPKQITDLSNDPPPFSSVKLEVNYYQRVFTIQVEMPPEFAVSSPSIAVLPILSTVL